MSDPWEKSAAFDPEGPDDLFSAAQEEVEDLWSDLSSARYHAYDQGKRWSLECDWFTERIVMLSRFAGSPYWEKIPTGLILDGTWRGILRTAGIDAGPLPTPAQLSALAYATQQGPHP